MYAHVKLDFKKKKTIQQAETVVQQKRSKLSLGWWLLGGIEPTKRGYNCGSNQLFLLESQYLLKQDQLQQADASR